VGGEIDAQRTQDLWVVVDDQDGGHGLLSSMMASACDEGAGAAVGNEITPR
jgi:hypothetical protein